jgi:hypothetical protein
VSLKEQRDKSNSLRPHGFQTEAGKFSVFNRLMSLFNTYGANRDLFCDGRNTLIKKFKTNLNDLYKPGVSNLRPKLDSEFKKKSVF